MDEMPNNFNKGTGSNKFEERLSSIQPKQLVLPVIIFILFVGSVIGVINYQRKAKEQAVPKVEITKPAENAVVQEAQIVVEGKTNPDIDVLVNEKEVKSDSKGNFAAEVALEEGENTLVVIATNKSEKETAVERKVTRGAKQAAPQAQAPAQPAAEAGEEITEEPVAEEAPVQPAQPTAGADLSSSGPETLWLGESALMSLAGVGYWVSRKKFAKSLRK